MRMTYSMCKWDMETPLEVKGTNLFYAMNVSTIIKIFLLEEVCEDSMLHDAKEAVTPNSENDIKTSLCVMWYTLMKHGHSFLHDV